MSESESRSRIIPAEEESGPSLVPPVREERVKEKPPEAGTARIAPSRELEAERRREMERLISEEVAKQSRG